MTYYWMSVPWWKKLLCWHSKFRVVRYHAQTVPPAWRGKELYVDEHDVHCFVQCCSCNRVFSTVQRDRLYGQKDDQ